MRRGPVVILLFLVLLGSFIAVSPPAYAATLTVGPSGSGAQYTTINSAVTAASAGDVVQVWAGTYTESVTLSKSISLV
jgi:pectin methylesterase-like acyl-CoA thioesterase